MDIRVYCDSLQHLFILAFDKAMHLHWDDFIKIYQIHWIFKIGWKKEEDASNGMSLIHNKCSVEENAQTPEMSGENVSQEEGGMML